jgi:hypothetical protein
MEAAGRNMQQNCHLTLNALRLACAALTIANVNVIALIHRLLHLDCCSHRRPGMQLIAEMEAAGRRRPGGDSPEITRRIAAMYDAYVAGMAEQQLLDFDDLLHHCLALLNNHPKVCGLVLFVKSVSTSVILQLLLHGRAAAAGL